MPGQAGDLKSDAAISPKTTGYPATYVDVVQGGEYEVADTTARDAIPFAWLRIQQRIRTTADGKTWRVSTLTAPSTIAWTEVLLSVAPTVQKNTTTGNVVLVQNAWREVVHAAAAATNYKFAASPVDGDIVDFIRSSAGTGTIALDGNGKNVEYGTTSAATWGPSSTLIAIRATYFAADTVWRLS